MHQILGGREFEGGCRWVYGRVWREQREGTNVIKLFCKNKKCLGRLTEVSVPLGPAVVQSQIAHRGFINCK